MTDNTSGQPDYLGHRQRLKERFHIGGGRDMADYEMLELLLTLAIPRKDTKPLAKELVKEFGSFAAVINAPKEKLLAFNGLKNNSIMVFDIVREAALRMSWQKLMEADLPVTSNWDAMVDYCRAVAGYKEREEFRIIFLNSKNRVMGEEIQQRGTVDSVAIHPGEVVKSSVLKGAKSIILLHNHPSGDVTPSAADIAITKKVKEGLASVDINLVDHLIVSKYEYFSFNDHGLLRR